MTKVFSIMSDQNGGALNKVFQLQTTSSKRGEGVVHRPLFSLSTIVAHFLPTCINYVPCYPLSGKIGFFPSRTHKSFWTESFHGGKLWVYPSAPSIQVYLRTSFSRLLKRRKFLFSKWKTVRENSKTRRPSFRNS